MNTAPATPPAGRASRSVRRLRGRPLWWVFGVLVAGIVLLLVLWDWNWFKGPLERRVHAATGRELEIAGDLDVDLGWTSTVRADRVRFSNAAWSDARDMASAERVEVDLALWPLLSGTVRLPDIRLQGPELRLETGPEGRGNWVLDTTPGGRFQTEFRRVEIDAGRLHFLDAGRDTDIEVAVRTVEDAASPSPPIVVEGKGRWQGNAFTLEGRADSPLDLRDADSPYRIDARAKAGATRAHAQGTLLDPLRLRGFDLQLALAGRDLADLYPLIGIAIPPTPPYTLDGRFTRQGTVWRYDDFEGKVGDSDLSGDANVDTAGERPYLRANLQSRRLDFDDLAGFVGGAPQSGGGETANAEQAREAAAQAARARVLPDTPYRLDKLRTMDADVRLEAARINAPRLPLDDMVAHLLLEDGVLRLDPLDFGVANGHLRTTLRMDAREDTLRTRADIQARGLDLAQLLPTVELARNAIGKVGGQLRIDTTGNSVADMLGRGDGKVLVGMGRGSISNLLMEMAGIDLAEIIKFELTEDKMIPVRCAFGDFDLEDGVMTANSLAFDTTDTLLLGEGRIDLGRERLDLTIRPRPKDRSLLSLRAPLKLDGSFRSPSIRPDIGALGLRGAIALALGSITPPAALLATIETGPGEDTGCGGQYAK
ncbi:AsmA family protein [Marilutibacter spongiae]|uniref:AsmA family protein n=1 Tax=Marilutibacter spongiae TaxID=2025720 RepID=A0A7W3Y5M7_9GAMM|nr:AsmA family protein [Lysobacter spongiae]MBB1060076.1 AsmA family protein [Lysobacter spongiae]